LESIRRKPLAQTVETFKELSLTGGRTHDRDGCLGKLGEHKIENLSAVAPAVSARPFSGPEFARIVFVFSQSARLCEFSSMSEGKEHRKRDV
jgi:hypothetical protein